MHRRLILPLISPPTADHMLVVRKNQDIKKKNNVLTSIRSLDTYSFVIVSFLSSSSPFFACVKIYLSSLLEKRLWFYLLIHLKQKKMQYYHKTDYQIKLYIIVLNFSSCCCVLAVDYLVEVCF